MVAALLAAGPRFKIDGRRIRRWTGLCLAVQLVFAVLVALGSHGVFVKLKHAATTDFVSFYAAGTLAGSAHPALVYDQAAHFAAERAASAPGIGYVHFFYPPVYLIVCRLLATLPYLPAFYLFECAGLALFLLTARAILRRPPGWWYLPLLSFSPVLWNFGVGQNAFLTASLFGGGTLLLQRRRPFWAGCVFGLLLYKPHTAVLLPLALLAGWQWRAIAGAALSVGLGVAGSAAWFGWQGWVLFARSLLRASQEFAAGGVTPFSDMVSVLGAVRDAGGGAGLAWVVQLVAQIVVAAIVAWCWHAGRRAPGTARYAALISGALLMMPVVLFYDLTLLAVAAAWIVRDARDTGFLKGEPWQLAGIWLGGLLCYPVTRAWHVPVGLICIVLTFTLAVRRQAACYRGVNEQAVTLNNAVPTCVRV